MTQVKLRVVTARSTNAASIILSTTLLVQVVGLAVHGEGVSTARSEARTEKVSGLSGIEVGTERVAARSLAVIVGAAAEVAEVLVAAGGEVVLIAPAHNGDREAVAANVRYRHILGVEYTRIHVYMYTLWRYR